MRVLMALLTVAVFGAASVAAADALAEARRLYNAGQYDSAARYAHEAMKMPATSRARGSSWDGFTSSVFGRPRRRSTSRRPARR